MTSDTPRKTLTLKPAAKTGSGKPAPGAGQRPSGSPQDDSAADRKRVGARARQAAQMQRQRDKDDRQAEPAAARTQAVASDQPRGRPRSAPRTAPGNAAPDARASAGRQERARPQRTGSAAGPALRRQPPPGMRPAPARQRPEQAERADDTRHGGSVRSGYAQQGDNGGSSREPLASRVRGPRHGSRTTTADTQPHADARQASPHAGDLVAGEPRADASRTQTAAGHAPARAPGAERFTVFAPCPQGLEQALADELRAIGFADAEPARAGCRFQADWDGVLRANLHSRLATRILVRLAHAPVRTEDDILALAQATAWERWFGPRQSLRVDTSAIRSPMQSLQYCNLRVKDGICDRLRDREGARPDIDTVRPDARVHLFLDETSATLYLDTTGESLFKRGWRLDKGEAPLRENLASGLLALSGWQPGQALLDPFCGSGTILIEAAGIALGAPPGIWRPFGFERLRTHDERRWRDLKDAARANMRSHLDTPLIGVDLNAGAIEAARANAKRAWLTPDAIDFRVADALTLEPPAEQGWIVTNPPYGERLEAAPETFWRQWSEQLKRRFTGWQVGAITSDLELPGRMRLKPRRRIPLHNGALECRLFLFDMVQDTYRR